MSRRRAQVELTAAVAAAVAVGPRRPPADELDSRILDATETLLRTAGLRRWSIDDVAERAGVGRTSVYRRFGGRDDLVHATLARELRSTLDAISHAASTAPDLESKAVAAVRAALAVLDGSLVDSLLHTDPATFLPYLTTGAGPLLAVARDAIAAQLAALGAPPAPELAEAAARLGLSFVLTRATVLPVADPDALAAAVTRLVRPFLTAGATC